MTAARVSWKQPGGEGARSLYVQIQLDSVTAEDLQIWTRFPEATIALCELLDAESANEYRRRRPSAEQVI